MAHLPRGLLILLTAWLAWSRPSAASRTESPNSGQWWESEVYSGIQQSAQQLRKTGDFPALEQLYTRGVELARHNGDTQAETSYLTALGNTHTHLFHYADAVRAYSQARDLALANNNWEAAGAVAPGLSSIHFLVGDWPAARNAIEEGLRAARKMTKRPYYEAQLKLQLARLSRDPRAILDAIDSARLLGEPLSDAFTLEAEGWDLLGEEWLSRDPDAAERALAQAHRLRALHARHQLHLSYLRLAELRLVQGRAGEAEAFTEKAIHASSTLAAGTLLHLRGRILEAQGRGQDALRAYEDALRSAQQWRALAPPPTRAALIWADTKLDENIVQSFVTAAATRTLSGDEAWTSKALLAVEQNRAASLRHSQDLAASWRTKLPAEYWKTLDRLRAEESRELFTGLHSELSETLHRELGEMESYAGLGVSPKKSESFSPQNSLKLFRQGLRNSELLLSFYSGTNESYLWALTPDSLNLYRLPSPVQIDAAVEEFQRAVSQHAPNARDLGEQLYSTLFGQLSERERAQRDWVLSLDGPLFGLPFAALRTEGQYLIEQHTLRRVPSALLSSPTQAPRSAPYLGLGDAVYNLADNRLPPSRLAINTPPGQLNRLISSGDEIARSAETWTGKAEVLTGVNATRGAFLNALQVTRPAVIHLATHVVMSQPANGQAYLAFSLGETGQPELLSSSEVATLNVPASLVVMTGCSSGTGETRPGAGLLGLTRAWLSAGASAVLATSWPIEDARGGLLPAFYREFKSVSAAEALRRGQAEMLHSGTWQADPAYWAAFHLTGGVQ